MKSLQFFAVAFMVSGLVLGSGGLAKADLIIDTTPSWDGSNFLNSFGFGNTATYGQTITAPTDGNTQLNSFVFEISTQSTLALSFRGYVYQWDGSEATGPALFSSSTMTVNNTGGFTAVTFNTGGINLTAGTQYVLFGSVSDPSLYNSSNGFSNWGSPLSDAYSGGQFVFLNNDGDPSQWTSTAWNTSFSSLDLAFTAYLSTPSIATPEPGSLALVLSATPAGLFFWLRHRKRSTA